MAVKDSRLVKDLDAAAKKLKAFGASVAGLGAWLAGLERELAAVDREDQRRRRPEFDLEGLDEAEAKTDVKGTFSAFAVAGLGSDGPAERTARITENLANRGT